MLPEFVCLKRRGVGSLRGDEKTGGVEGWGGSLRGAVVVTGLS